MADGNRAGLEGIVAARTAISDVDGERGELIYQGYDIVDLANNSSFEETTYLIWNGRLPNRRELDALSRRLAENRTPPEEVMALLRAFPKHVAPMDALRTAVSALGLYDPAPQDDSREANVERAIRLVAQTPTLVAGIERLRHGLSPIEPRADLSLAANFLYMLGGEEPTGESAHEFDVALILHIDHELNASAFASRVITSTRADMYSAVTGAVGALSGPLHGGANQRVMETLAEIGKPERAGDYVRDLLARGERVMGFGHRVYKVMDPRAKVLKSMSHALGERHGNTRWYEISAAVEEVMREEKDLYPNVDFYSASFYHELGIPTDLFPAVFAMSRMTGWTAHVLEQQADNRLIRPRAEYVGERNARYVPVEQR
jgi:citrate synthase